MKKTLLIILGILVVLIIASGVWYFLDDKNKTEDRACTMEAKLCPDGSYVGRVAPNCEFAECPEDKFKDWTTYLDSKFSYKCPGGWSLNKNKNYDGLVDLSECVISDPSNQFSFDDGIVITFGFVSEDVLNAGDNRKYAASEWDGIKSKSNAQPYKNNNFLGWIVPNTYADNSFVLIARYQINNNYYEVQALGMGNMGGGDIKTIDEARKIIDEIISTFEIK